MDDLHAEGLREVRFDLEVATAERRDVREEQIPVCTSDPERSFAPHDAGADDLDLAVERTLAERKRREDALVGIESVTTAGLKDVYKGFNLAGDDLVARLRVFKRHGVHVLGSFIFGLPSDDAHTFATTVDLAERADITFAQFVLLTPFPGTIDFEKWAAKPENQQTMVDGVPVTTHWLIPQEKRPKLFNSCEQADSDIFQLFNRVKSLESSVKAICFESEVKVDELQKERRNTLKGLNTSPCPTS